MISFWFDLLLVLLEIAAVARVVSVSIGGPVKYYRRVQQVKYSVLGQRVEWKLRREGCGLYTAAVASVGIVLGADTRAL